MRTLFVIDNKTPASYIHSGLSFGTKRKTNTLTTSAIYFNNSRCYLEVICELGKNRSISLSKSNVSISEIENTITSTFWETGKFQGIWTSVHKQLNCKLPTYHLNIHKTTQMVIIVELLDVWFDNTNYIYGINAVPKAIIN